MPDKEMPNDMLNVESWIRERATGHAPGYDIVVYARSHVWLALASEIERLRTVEARALARTR